MIKNGKHIKEKQQDLKGLKDLGFTHLGLEMVSTDDQQAIDRYLQDRVEDQLVEVLEKWRYWLPQGTDSYLELIKEAKNVGLNVFGIDIPRSEENWQDKQDEWMTNSVRKILEQVDANKVITFTGIDHSSKEPETMAQTLKWTPLSRH